MKLFDHEWTDEVVCPYCGTEDPDCVVSIEDEGDAVCQQCGEQFEWIRHVDVHFSTERRRQ